MISSVDNRTQDPLPLIMSNLNLQQMKNRKSEGCKKYNLSLNLHCNFPIFIFEKFVKGTCVTIHDLIIFSGLSSVGFKTSYFYMKHPMVIREDPVKSPLPVDLIQYQIPMFQLSA